MTIAQPFVLTSAPIVHLVPGDQTTPARIAVANWYRDRSERSLMLVVARIEANGRRVSELLSVSVIVLGWSEH